jgi:TonB family protein
VKIKLDEDIPHSVRRRISGEALDIKGLGGRRDGPTRLSDRQRLPVATEREIVRPMKRLLIPAVLALSAGCASAFAERNTCSEPEVEVAVLIDSTGHVKSVTVLKESPCPEFNETAVRIARKEVYVPATRNGQPVSSANRHTIRFKPADGPSRPGTDLPPR